MTTLTIWGRVRNLHGLQELEALGQAKEPQNETAKIVGDHQRLPMQD